MNFTELDRLVKTQRADLSIILKNLNTGQILYERMTHKKMRSASIIKLFILSKCADAFEKGQFNPHQTLSLQENDKVAFSLLSDLKQNVWRLDDMATLMIILSDNTATNLLIDLLHMDKINDHIESLGSEKTVLQRKMMDSDAASQGLENYTCLHDAALLLEGIFKRASADHQPSQWMLSVLDKQRDTSMLQRFLPESVKIAHKTGLNQEIQHDIGLFKAGQDTYLFGVFMQGEADDIKAFECIGRLAKHMYEEVTNG